MADASVYTAGVDRTVPVDVAGGDGEALAPGFAVPPPETPEAEGDGDGDGDGHGEAVEGAALLLLGTGVGTPEAEALVQGVDGVVDPGAAVPRRTAAGTRRRRQRKSV